MCFGGGGDANGVDTLGGQYAPQIAIGAGAPLRGRFLRRRQENVGHGDQLRASDRDRQMGRVQPTDSPCAQHRKSHRYPHTLPPDTLDYSSDSSNTA